MSRLFLIIKGDSLTAEAEAARRGFEIVAESRDFGYGRTRVEVTDIDTRTGINVGRYAARWLAECPPIVPPGGFAPRTLIYYDTVRERDTDGVPEFVVDVVD